MAELKILGGNAKGRKLKTCKGLRVRPMLSRVKKSLFDIIQNKILDAHCLDLFSGTGSIGLEAISRGAKGVTFIEKHPDSLKIIKHNIDLLGFKEKCKIISGDVFSSVKNLSKKFDLIFADPPFPELILKEILKPVSNNDILKEDGVMIIHHPSYNNTFIENLENLECKRQAKYGQNTLSFYKKITSKTSNSEGRY